MERIIKYIKISIAVLGLSIMPSFADVEMMSLSTLITAQNVPFDSCTKVFNTDNTSLFYLTISAINANRFDINEIQSKSGYVIFTAVNKEFIAIVSNVNKNQGMIKITPVNGNYYFQPGICLNIFKYIELNMNQKPDVIF